MEIQVVFREGYELVVTTESSVWVVRKDSYKRSSRNGPRPALATIDGNGEDDRWINHQGTWVLEDEFGFRLRVLPEGRPSHFSGIKSGVIQDVQEREIDDSDEG